MAITARRKKFKFSSNIQGKQDYLLGIQLEEGIDKTHINEKYAYTNSLATLFTLYNQERYSPLAYLAKEKAVSSQVLTGRNGSMGSIPAISDARYVPSLLFHELFNEANLPDQRR